ncbi:MAG: substrate-binding domain-containing protein [Abitibacteriaceae bacterium]|nr:substrate-binding domain-containing protein [Abditibacteriaceae bacterium]
MTFADQCRALGLSGLLAFGLALTGCNQASTDNTSSTTTNSATASSSSNSTTTTTTTTTSGQKGTYLIGMSQANKGEPWRQAMNDQIAAAAAKHPELQVVFADAAQNNAKQVADVENFIQQGIKLLIISPNEAAPLTDVVAKAYDKGIPVIVLDREVNGNKYTMWIGADNTAIGKMAGQFVAKWAKDNKANPCNVLEIRGLEGTPPTKERDNGFRAGIAANPAVKIIAQQTANWTRERAIPVSQAMIQANPNFNVVYGENDPMAEAAIISAKNANKDLSKILFVGIDGLPTPDGGIKSVMNGRLGVTYVYPTGGAEAIDWAVKILEQKQKPPRKVVLKTEEVNKSNAAALYKKYGGK